MRPTLYKFRKPMATAKSGRTARGTHAPECLTFATPLLIRKYGRLFRLDARAHRKFTLFSWFPRSASPRPRPQCPRNGREESLPAARSGRYNATLPVPTRHGAAARGPATGLPENFLHCVRTRGEPAAPVEVGHRSATVCHLEKYCHEARPQGKLGPCGLAFRERSGGRPHAFGDHAGAVASVTASA
jgi:hypothetical protein